MRRAAADCVQVAKLAWFKRIETLTGGTLDADIEKDLQWVARLRHRIVHELLEVDVHTVDIKKAARAASDYAQHLGAMAKAHGLPTRTVEA